MVADEHGLQLGGMMDGVGTVGSTINIERTYAWIRFTVVTAVLFSIFTGETMGLPPFV